MQIDKKDYEILKSALQRFQEMMSDDQDDEQNNSKEINVCKKYISLINKPVETTNEQPKVIMNNIAEIMFHEGASEASNYNRNNEFIITMDDAYRSGYLDCYNLIKRWLIV